MILQFLFEIAFLLFLVFFLLVEFCKVGIEFELIICDFGEIDIV